MTTVTHRRTERSFKNKILLKKSKYFYKYVFVYCVQFYKWNRNNLRNVLIQCILLECAKTCAMKSKVGLLKQCLDLKVFLYKLK